MITDRDIKGPRRTEDEKAIDNILQPSPKMKPPRYDRRTPRIDSDDNDIKHQKVDNTRDIDKAYVPKKVATMDRTKLAKKIAAEYFSAKRIIEEVVPRADGTDTIAAFKSYEPITAIDQSDMDKIVKDAKSRVDSDLKGYNKMIAARTALDLSIWSCEDGKYQARVTDSLYRDLLAQVANSTETV